eukprot:3923911-Heterocapsa_arctica.AAC.1
MQQWKAELDHLQQQQVRQMQFLTESIGELRDRRPQSGNDQCHWKMVTADVLERGMPSERQILGRYGAVRLTRTEALNIVKMRKLPFNFFAVLEVSQY